MRRVAEIIYIVPERRENFLSEVLNLNEEALKVLWLCGIRKQQYFALNELLFMTFEYDGKNFDNDMKKMAAFLDQKGLLIKTRRKDVPIDERTTTDWWAPVKRLGTNLDETPFAEEVAEYRLMDYLDGTMVADSSYGDTAYDEDDWSEGLHF